MKTSTTQIYVAFRYVISTLLTNISRHNDSKPNSGDNLRMQEGFIATGGWSPEFPAKLSPMTAWPFEKRAGSMPNGVTAQEYVDAENKARKLTLEKLEKTLANATADDARKVAANELDAYKDLYCEADGSLTVLTVDNAYWASSGHQRSEFVMRQAYTQWRWMRDQSVAASEDAGIKDKFPEFNQEIPALVVEYFDINEVAMDQIRGNSAAANQNKLGVLDYTKSARRMIGYGMAPKLKENEFRQICSGLEKGNSGAASRSGFLNALVDYYLTTGLGGESLINCLFAPTTIPSGIEGGDPIPNPNYVPVSWVALGHTDPMTDISVVARLLEVGLDKLTKYESKYNAEFRKSGLAKDDKLSAVEHEVLKRGYSWNKEEAKRWLDSRKINAGGTPPVEAKAEKKFDAKQLDGLASSPAAPMIVNALVKEIKDGTSMEDNANMAKIQALKPGLDALFTAADDADFQAFVVTLGILRDADKALFAATLAECDAIVARKIKEAVAKPTAETPAVEAVVEPVAEKVKSGKSKK